MDVPDGFTAVRAAGPVPRAHRADPGARARTARVRAARRGAPHQPPRHDPGRAALDVRRLRARPRSMGGADGRQGPRDRLADRRLPAAREPGALDRVAHAGRARGRHALVRRRLAHGATTARSCARGPSWVVAGLESRSCGMSRPPRRAADRRRAAPVVAAAARTAAMADTAGLVAGRRPARSDVPGGDARRSAAGRTCRTRLSYAEVQARVVDVGLAGRRLGPGTGRRAERPPCR